MIYGLQKKAKEYIYITRGVVWRMRKTFLKGHGVSQTSRV
jgi:hypothetical protein